MNNQLLYLVALSFLVASSGYGQKKIKLKEKDSKYGFYQGKSLISDTVYDEVQEKGKVYFVRVNNKWGVTDKLGKELIPIVYDTLIPGSNMSYIVKANNAYGVIDSMNYLIVPVEFDRIDHIDKNGVALVKKFGKWGEWVNGTLDFNSDTLIFHRPDKEALFMRCPGEFDTFDELAQCSKTEMLKYIYMNLSYPYEARNNGIQGMVVSSFLISPTGKICCHKVLKSDHNILSEYSLKVLGTLDNWVPAVNEGVNVWSRYIIPTKYRLP